jgi:hypothetical protein
VAQGMKILLLDVETAPNLVHVWGLWQQNVGLPQILDSGYVLCWAAKWLGQDDVHFDSIYDSSPKKMLKGIHTLLNEADAVIHYNGTKFDIPTLNKEFILHGMSPPAPYRQIDLLQVARRQFRFPSNKLDYVANALGFGKKVKHRGHELWIQCMEKDPQAWEEMKEYNIHDVVLLEQVYERLLPWIKNHPNQNLYGETGVCPSCGSVHSQRRGYAFTSASKYQRYVCKDCHTWFRGTKVEKIDKEFMGV